MDCAAIGAFLFAGLQLPATHSGKLALAVLSSATSISAIAMRILVNYGLNNKLCSSPSFPWQDVDVVGRRREVEPGTITESLCQCLQAKEAIEDVFSSLFRIQWIPLLRECGFSPL